MAASSDNVITQALRVAITQAIRQARIEIKWKPGKAVAHLQKRIQLRQLSSDATLAGYEAIIRGLLHDPNGLIYLYFYNDAPYPVIIAEDQGQLWAVIINLEGRLDTAFLLLKPEQYIERRGLVYLGRLHEVDL